MAIVSSGPEQRHAIRARAGRVIGVFIVGVLIVASMYLYNYLTTANRFAIEKVELAGLSRIEPAELERLAGDLRGQNILLAPLDAVETRLESHPRVASVECRRVLPNRVIYSISEREPMSSMIWSAGSRENIPLELFALRARSFWYVFAIHASLGVLTDVFILFG